MTKSETLDLLMKACTIAQGYYRAKAETDGISATQWVTYMGLVDKYDRLYTDLLLDFFKDFAKENA